ncbi:hypothetical protein LXL04_011571 [Taraxacum kok-saghyz]
MMVPNSKYRVGFPPASIEFTGSFPIFPTASSSFSPFDPLHLPASKSVAATLLHRDQQRFPTESRRIGSREATYVFVNPEIPETEELLTSYQRNTQFVIPKSHPLITLQELAAKDHSELRGKTFISKARIDGFEMNTLVYRAMPKMPKTDLKKGKRLVLHYIFHHIFPKLYVHCIRNHYR